MDKKMKALNVILRKKKLETEIAEELYQREQRILNNHCERRDTIKGFQNTINDELTLALEPGNKIDINTLHHIQVYSREIDRRAVEIENEVIKQTQIAQRKKSEVSKNKLKIKQIEHKIDETKHLVNCDQLKRAQKESEELFSIGRNSKFQGFV